MEPIDKEIEYRSNDIENDVDEIVPISSEAENKCIFKCYLCNFITGCSKWLSSHANLHQIQDLTQFVNKVF